MSSAWHLLKPNHYLSTHARLIKEWQNQDVVAFSQLIDFTRIVEARLLRATEGRRKPTYTACVLDAIAKTLRHHPKMNRIVYRGLTGYQWAQFENIDIAVAAEATEGDTDIAFATIVRNADERGVDALAELLHRVSTAPSDDPQLNRLRRLPAAITGALARGTGLHPKLWVRFRGGSCALTSPAKYGIENVLVKSCWPIQFAFGNVKQRPMVVNGECLPRHSAMLSMSWHRELTTGAVAARFFEDIVQRLQSGIADPVNEPPPVIPQPVAQWRTADM
jgi:pyruvate/2-oxoglutarate dehydrogenase complex dihydrolipoamide acyltransferase (E2) component